MSLHSCYQRNNTLGLVRVSRHPFFSQLKWDDLIQRRVPPPFRPELSDAYDLRNIDPVFTREPVPTSHVDLTQATFNGLYGPLRRSDVVPTVTMSLPVSPTMSLHRCIVLQGSNNSHPHNSTSSCYCLVHHVFINVPLFVLNFVYYFCWHLLKILHNSN